MFYSVYRGLTNSFTIETSVLPSITFCGNKATAEYYAYNANDRRLGKGTATVYSAKIEINSPIVVREDYSGMSLNDLGKVYGKADQVRLFSKFKDYFLSTVDWENYRDSGEISGNLEMELLQRNKRLFDICIPAYVFLDDPDIIRDAMKCGFDGSINRGTAVSANDIEYRVFSPDQIKESFIVE